MSRICKWLGHRKPTERQSGWFSPGEEYATRVEEAGVDGIQRIHARVYDKCDRCGKEYLLCRIHIPGTIMKSSYGIIKYQRGRLGERLSEELNENKD